MRPNRSGHADEATKAGRMTLEEFEDVPEGMDRMELVRGQVVREPPAGGEHGALAADLGGRLAEHVRRRKLGVVFAAETGFKLADDPAGTVRAPDVAFVSENRVPEEGIPRGFWPGAPDLAVEVRSPSNTPEEILDKVSDYLDAGARMVWVLHPRARTITVYRSMVRFRVLEEADTLEGEDVVPGFRVRIGEVFR